MIEILIRDGANGFETIMVTEDTRNLMTSIGFRDPETYVEKSLVEHQKKCLLMGGK